MFEATSNHFRSNLESLSKQLRIIFEATSNHFRTPYCGRIIKDLALNTRLRFKFPPTQEPITFVSPTLLPSDIARGDGQNLENRGLEARAPKLMILERNLIEN